MKAKIKPTLTLLKSVLKSHSKKTALEVNDESFTYSELFSSAHQISKLIVKYSSTPKNPVALFAYRSFLAFSGVLGILGSGKPYVPLNPKFPLVRNLSILDASSSDMIIIDERCFQNAIELLKNSSKNLKILIPHTIYSPNLPKQFPKHTFISISARINKAGYKQFPLVSPSLTDLAYILFTSGSTGIPKGVPISHKNLASYIKNFHSLFSISSSDRFSQMFDFTFDLSVHDMFICWTKAACLCVIPEKSAISPTKYIIDKRLTVWFSVPSVASFMYRMKILKPSIFPHLRLSFFCGEALTSQIVSAWQDSASKSKIINLYGPTETTISITRYLWDNKKSFKECRNGIVPIGFIFPNQHARIVDGELCLSGTQVTTGYLGNPIKTKAQFVKLPNSQKYWYKTGDLAFKDKNNCYFYLGRIDNQVKILGYRVELQEIEFLVRTILHTDLVVAAGWPIYNGNAQGIILFIEKTMEKNSEKIISECKKSLPTYMVPRKIYTVETFPLNSNGKIDRGSLLKQL